MICFPPRPLPVRERRPDWFDGHSSGVSSVTYFANGRYIASGSWDRTILIWDSASAELLHVLRGHENPVKLIHASERGSYLLSISKAGEIFLWSQLSWQPAFRVRNDDVSAGVLCERQGTPVFAFATTREVVLVEPATGKTLCSWLSPAGATAKLAWCEYSGTLVIGTTDGMIATWSVSNDKDPKVQLYHNCGISYIALANYGRLIIFVDDFGRIHRYDQVTKQSFMIGIRALDEVSCLSVSRNGCVVVTGYVDGRVTLAPVSRTEKESLLGRHVGRVTGLAFSADLQSVASSSEDGCIRIWLTGGVKDPVKLCRASVSITSLDVSPNAAYIACGLKTGAISLHDVNGELHAYERHGHKGDVNTVSFCPNGLRIATASDDCEVRVWEVPDLSIMASFKLDGGCALVTWSECSQLVAVVSDYGNVAVLDTQQDVSVAELRFDGKKIVGLRFLDKENRICLISADGTFVIWNIHSNVTRMTNIVGNDEVSCFDLSSNSKQIVLGTKGGMIYSFCLQKEDVIRAIEGHERSVATVRFDARGRRFVSASWDRTACVWDAEAGERLLVLPRHERPLSGAVFAQDGNLVVTAAWDGVQRVWDVASGELRLVLHMARDGAWASIDPVQKKVVAKGGPFWRYLGWRAQLPDGSWTRIPFEALPAEEPQAAAP